MSSALLICITVKLQIATLSECLPVVFEGIDDSLEMFPLLFFLVNWVVVLPIDDAI